MHPALAEVIDGTVDRSANDIFVGVAGDGPVPPGADFTVSHHNVTTLAAFGVLAALDAVTPLERGSLIVEIDTGATDNDPASLIAAVTLAIGAGVRAFVTTDSDLVAVRRTTTLMTQVLDA